jgi:hypothetical protein
VQTVPQEPQLPLSACVFTQELPHAVSAPQSAEQDPAMHIMPLGQGVLQSPQCKAFALVSMQLPEQFA